MLLYVQERKDLPDSVEMELGSPNFNYRFKATYPSPSIEKAASQILPDNDSFLFFHTFLGVMKKVRDCGAIIKLSYI